MARFSVYKLCLLLGFLGFLILSFLLITNKTHQHSLTNYFYPDKRVVLASLNTNLGLPNKSYKVIKIQQAKNILIEIYDLTHKDLPPVQFKLPSNIDGQMHINKKTSPLFASDLDGDHILEIVSPTFSTQFQPQVHAFKLKPESGEFYQMSAEMLLKLL